MPRLLLWLWGLRAFCCIEGEFEVYIWKPAWAEDEEVEPGPRPDGWAWWGLVNRSKVYVLFILNPGAMEFSWLHFVTNGGEHMEHDEGL
jgi:hypothetical protein